MICPYPTAILEIDLEIAMTHPGRAKLFFEEIIELALPSLSRQLGLE